MIVALAAMVLVAGAPARIVDRIADSVRKALPAATITMTDAHGFTVQLPKREDFQVNVERIEDFCSVNSKTDCDDQVTAFATNIVTMATADFTVTKDRLRVIVRNQADTEGYLATIPEAAKRPLVRPLTEGLSAVLAADFPQGTRMVSSLDLRELGLTADDAFALGNKQVIASLPPVPAASDVAGKVIVVSGFDYGASALLAPERWRSLNDATQGRLFIAIPSDGEVLIGTIKPGDDVIKLREYVSEAYSTAPRGVSPLLFHWSQGDWVAIK